MVPISTPWWRFLHRYPWGLVFYGTYVPYTIGHDSARKGLEELIPTQDIGDEQRRAV